MRKLEIKLPADVNLSESDLKMLLAATLFDLGKVSYGEAAVIAGISTREFIESVEKNGAETDL